MTKCKTEGCELEVTGYDRYKEGDAREGYCCKCVRNFMHLPVDERVKILAARQAIDGLWDAIMNLDEQAQNYFIECINDACRDECNPRDDHNIVWR